MEFEAVLEQTIALLQRQGRISYGALKRRFQLDDAYLEDLKVELIEAQQLARDENNRILVWVGETTPAPHSPHSREDHAPQSEHIHAAHRVSEAERRQLTVMFCDLVDSTALAGQFDPEDLREVVRAYQQTGAVVIQRFDGYIAQYLGDGLLVYFGYPRAHEDDAQRAVRGGLGVLQAMGTLNARLTQRYGVRLAVRIGIHTGMVVVGEMGGGNRQEQLALGETPNVAARLQGLAAPDSIAISDATFRLIRGYFTCQDLGRHTLKGVVAPLQAYRVLEESAAQSRLDVVGIIGFTPLVGRDAEVALLLERWAQSQEGRGQVVLLRGEAGIGKSRLVEMLRERVRSAGATRVVFRCSPYHQNSALYPVIDHLQRFLQWQRDDTPEAKFDKLEQVLQTYRLPLDNVMPLFAVLLSVPLPERYPPLHLTPERQRQKTHEALVTWLLEEAERHPVLAVWEDLHWADPSTLDILSLMLDQVSTARMLTLLTCRPEFHPPWATHAPVTQVTLNRLGRVQVEAMITSLAGGKTLPPDIVEQVIAKTDGIPLFVEELVKMILESGMVQEQADRYVLTGPLPPLAIPTTLHDSLMARLDRLATARELAQLGAVLGREFSYELVQAVAPMDETTLQQGLSQLVDAELVYQRGVPPRSQYVFKHALVQDTAYQSLLKSTRQQYHQRIAQVLVARFAELVETQPELLAHHYTEAGLVEQAIPAWQRAGERTSERSAYAEAIGHLTRGLEILRTFPETPERARRELMLQNTLGQALIATQGYGAAAVERVYLRARELSQHVEEITQVFPALYGVWVFHYIRSEFRTAHALGADMLQRAQQYDDPTLRLVAHRLVGTTWCYLGGFLEARDHLEQVLTGYDPQQHRGLARQYSQDVGVAGGIFLSWTLWCLGYPDQALARAHEALTLARHIAHPFSLAFALNLVATVHQFRREAHATHELAETAMALCREQGFAFWSAYAVLTRSLAFATLGHGAEEQPQIHQNLKAASNMRTYWLVLLAEAYGKGAQAAEGLRLLAEALAAVGDMGEYFWEAELYRLQGELRLALSTDNHAEAEACLHQALVVARHQQAKSLELRAATSLARLWQRQGKRDAARQQLTEVYYWFTEGFDTADLQEAKALLEELS